MKLYCQWYPSTVFLQPRGLVGPPVLLPEKHLPLLGCIEDPGHRSVMMFDQRHVDFSYENPGLWTGRQFPQFSNFLFIDVDENGTKNIGKLERIFTDFDHLVYASGGHDKYHFILPHNLISSMDLGCIYRLFLSKADIGHDPSVYAPLCGMALPGTIHRVTGVKKHLLRTKSGRKFRFDDLSCNAIQALGERVFRSAAW